MTSSELMAIVLTMALCPDRFCKKVPSGHFHSLMLSGAPDANVYSLGLIASERTDFL